MTWNLPVFLLHAPASLGCLVLHPKEGRTLVATRSTLDSPWLSNRAATAAATSQAFCVASGDGAAGLASLEARSHVETITSSASSALGTRASSVRRRLFGIRASGVQIRRGLFGAARVLSSGRLFSAFEPRSTHAVV